ncbi:MAG: hypothetical protein P8J55_10325 [Pseudomonadales bacterium]|nr:hypothetical protein [Pseudomonadales bacterium]
MSVTGNYKVMVDTPFGSREVTLTLNVDGDSASGMLAYKEDSPTFTDGIVDGDRVTWGMDISMPIPMHLTCEAIVAGDAISGSIKLGGFGDSTFSGNRI